jgi:hypothetical protein
MVSDMKANGSDLTAMDMVNRCGQMVHATKVNGKKIKHQERVHLLMQMVINIKVNGKTTKHMAMVFSYTRNHLLGMKDIGRMI